METCYDEVKYWNTVYEGQNIYSDNLWKRKEQIKMLCDYNFENKKILELGMGNCSLALAFKRFIGIFAKYQGIDISDVAVDFANKHAIKAIQADVRNIPLDDKYDFIIAFDILEHIPPSDRTQVYREINRLLASDGLVLLHRSFMPSQHDVTYDHHYDIHDIAELCREIDGDIVTAKTYYVTIGKKRFMNVYQMIGLSRKEK